MSTNYVTPQEIAADLGIKTSTARNYVRSQMEHIRIGNGRILVDVVEYERWKLARTQHPDTEYVSVRRDIYDEIMKGRKRS